MPRFGLHSLLSIGLRSIMVRFSPDFKHYILTQYQANLRGRGFSAVAQRFGVKGGSRTVRYWYSAWDGTPASLQRKPVSGRPRALTRAEVTRYIRTPIQRRNRAHLPIHYNEVHRTINEVTSKSPSIQTIRRYGRQELRARNKRTRKRTTQECKHRHICGCFQALISNRLLTCKHWMVAVFCV